MSIENRLEIMNRANVLVASGDMEGIRALLVSLHPSDSAKVLEGVDEASLLAVFRLLSPEYRSEVLLEIDDRLRENLLAAISDIELVEVVDEMETDDAADVISELPVEDAKKVLDGIDRKESIEVQKLLKYPDDTAGGKMQAELVAVSEEATVEQAVGEVRKKSEAVENISNVFVVDRSGVLTGIVPLDKLILARTDRQMSEIAAKNPVKVETGVDQEDVASMFRRYDLLSMPVVDAAGVLVGRITVDDMVDVIEEEIFEDFYRMASLNAGERVLDSARRSFGMRSPWLLINLVTAFAAASVVKLFEGTIETFVILAVLLPVVAGLGGNAATQTLTIVVRGLALGELELRHAKRVLVKEAMVGLANGLLVGTVAAFVAYLLGANYIIGLLLFLAMTANLVIAGLSGSAIPLILKWLRADPALSAIIFVTACTEVGGFFTFLGLAALFMKMGLL